MASAIELKSFGTAKRLTVHIYGDPTAVEEFDFDRILALSYNNDPLSNEPAMTVEGGVNSISL